MVRILKFYTAILASAPCVLAKSDCLPELDWDEFQKCFSKQYATLEHSQAHQKAYKQNLNLVQNCNKRYNAGQQSYSCSTNQYSDYPTSRLQELMLHPIQYSHDEHVARVEYIEDTPPSSINWIEKGAVTSVKNQGTCGSCWAFSSVGALESHYQIETGALRELSEQQLLDCSGYLGTMGCKGGNIEKAFEYIVENHGLDGLQDYPYSGVDGLPCDKNRTQRHIAVMFNFSTTLPNSEAQLEAAVGKYGPVAVAIQANQTSFLQYKQGIFDDESCGTSLDHGVLVVGYTKDYWIVKNSWGDTWGEKGYIRMKRGVGTKGICGIASFPSFPRVHKGKALPIPGPTPSPPPGLPCLCTTSCQRMCLQFGMHCCDGTGGNCNCQPPRETCCTKGFLPEPSLIAKSESAQPAQEG